LALEVRLVGYDNQWRVYARPEAHFTGLPPGQYTVEARVLDAERQTRSVPVSLAFEISPPWWATLWFRAGVVLAGLLVLMLLMRWRERDTQRRALALEALVQERTVALAASNARLEELASKDGLTGVNNRRVILEILARELERARREGVALMLVMADIDHFKRINDSHGHAAGDDVLREFTRRLQSVIRPYDAIGRYGGEEFLLVLPGLSAGIASDRVRLANIHAVISNPPMLAHGTPLTVTCSFGVVDGQGGTPGEAASLIHIADQALYRAKAEGRNRIAYAESEASLQISARP
jgi:diguanylate cyclase (GGDEF)-like protein